MDFREGKFYMSPHGCLSFWEMLLVIIVIAMMLIKKTKVLVFIKNT